MVRPQAHVAAYPTTMSNSWLLHSEASHYVTNDLGILSLHALYDGTEELIIGDGSSLPITHIGSLKFSVYSHLF